MANIVSNDGTTMMSGFDTSKNSEYTGKLYDSGNYTSYTGIDYPNNKYYDKYSFSTDYGSIINSKLGDGIKEVYDSSMRLWYGAYFKLVEKDNPWFIRSINFNAASNAGLFNSDGDKGAAKSYNSSRLIITPQSN